MINQEKVALMTKLAIYEENEGRKNIPMGKYYKDDYVSLHMVNTVIVATFSYVLVIAAIVFAHIEQMMVLMVIYLYILVTCSYSNLARSI